MINFTECEADDFVSFEYRNDLGAIICPDPGLFWSMHLTKNQVDCYMDEISYSTNESTFKFVILKTKFKHPCLFLRTNKRLMPGG